jgi:hypothetical protein
MATNDNYTPTILSYDGRPVPIPAPLPAATPGPWEAYQRQPVSNRYDDLPPWERGEDPRPPWERPAALTAETDPWERRAAMAEMDPWERRARKEIAGNATSDTLKDVAGGAGAGLVKGAASLFAVPGDVMDLISAGRN